MQTDEVDTSDDKTSANPESLANPPASLPERATTAQVNSGQPPYPEHPSSHVLEGSFICVLHHGTKYSSHSQRYYVTVDLSGNMHFFRQRKDESQTIPSSLASNDATDTVHIRGARVIDRGTRRRKPCFSLALPHEDELQTGDGLNSGRAVNETTSSAGVNSSSSVENGGDCRVHTMTNSSARSAGGTAADSEGEKYVLVNHADLLFVQREVFFYTTDKMLKWKWICALQHLCGTCQGLYGPCEMFQPRERVVSVKADDASVEPCSPRTAAALQNGVSSEAGAAPVVSPDSFPDVQGLDCMTADTTAANMQEPLSPKLLPSAAGAAASQPDLPEVESLEAVLQRYAAKQRGQEEREQVDGSGTSGSNGALDTFKPEGGGYPSPESPLSSSFASRQRYQSSFVGGGDGNVSAAAQVRMERSPLYATCLADELCNQECADCGERYPTWCVLQPFGVFVCIDCCGVHRSLWPSKCREIELDHWTQENINFMASRGNALMNKELEYHCCRHVPENTQSVAGSASPTPADSGTATSALRNEDTKELPPPSGACVQTAAGSAANANSGACSVDDDDVKAGVVPVYKPYGRHSSHTVRHAYISAKYRGEFSRQRNIPRGEPFYYPVFDPVGVHRGRRTARNVSFSYPTGAGAQPALRKTLSFNAHDTPTATDGPPRYIGVVDLQLKEAEGVQCNGTSNLIAVLANGFQEIRTRPGRVSAPTPIREESDGTSWLPAKQARKLLRLGLAATRSITSATTGKAGDTQQQQQQQQLAVKPKVKKLRGPLPQVRILPPASALGSVTWDEVLHIGIDHISRPLYVTVYDSSDNVLATAVIVLSELLPPVSEEPHLMTVPLRCQRITEDVNDENRALDTRRKVSEDVGDDDAGCDNDDAAPSAGAKGGVTTPVPAQTGDTHSVAVCGSYYHHTRGHKSTIVQAVPLFASLLGPSGPTVEIETAPPLLYFVVSFQVMG